MSKIFHRPEALTDLEFTYCPGCSHGLVHRLIAEVIDELRIREKAIGLAPVGCSVYAYDFFNCDMIQVAHGRAPAVATGIKRVRPECIVFSYQGDGDLIAIGTAEIVHAAARGENITVIFINNAVFGMTRGQMAPTTLVGQKTTTSRYGRRPKEAGYPIRVCELLATLQGPAYLARVTVTSPQKVRQAKRAIKKAFRAQIEEKGFSLVEVLSACPVMWHMSPIEAMRWIDEKMVEYYPLGEFVNKVV